MEENVEKDNKKPNTDEDIKVTVEKNVEFFMLRWKNKILFPLMILLFLISEGINVVYLRMLAKYANETDVMSQDTIFANPNQYWIALFILQIFYFVFSIGKYACLGATLLFSITSLHEMMLYSVICAPLKYF